MDSNSVVRCPRCGAMLLSTENFCPQCGTRLFDAEPAGATPPSAQASLPENGGPPSTIEELQAFCAVNEMLLDRMRFFIGTNIRQPRAFGIYREGDSFVVYKNKDNGSRAVRYHGPDEAWAVKELYEKLLDECHKRNIWPDGKPEGWDEARRKAKRRTTIIMIATVLVIVAMFGVFAFLEARAHRGDGYYRFDDRGTYYRYGGDWYYYDTYYDWVPVDDYPYYDDYGEYYLGDDYDRSWAGSDFKSSDAWESIESEKHTSSQDYDTWDAGDTDWSSDW